jgi:hypothetical protein
MNILLPGLLADHDTGLGILTITNDVCRGNAGRKKENRN